MLRKISSYFAIIVLSMSFTVDSVRAAATSKNESKAVAVVIDQEKNHNLFSRFMTIGGKHLYTVKVKSDQQVRIVMHAKEAISLKIKNSDGEVLQSDASKYVEVKLRAAGEYSIELDSVSLGYYRLETFTK